MALIASACVAFAVFLVGGPARAEEGIVQAVWQAWRGFWSREGGEVHLLARDEVLRLPAGREGFWVRVEAGTVVVTREGAPVDHVLQEGAELRLPGRGLSLAWALEPSRVDVRRGGEARGAERPAPSRPVPVAR
jgi:hypothetical protein